MRTQRSIPTVMVVVSVVTMAAAATAQATAVDEARKQLTEAHKRQAQAETDFRAVTGRLRSAFEASPEVTNATAAVTTAQNTYEAARQPVLTALGAKPDYQAAVNAREQARQAMRDLQSAPDPDRQQIAALAAEWLSRDSAVDRMEQAALDAAPAVREAKAKLDRAAADLAGLRTRFEQSLTKDPDWQKAKQMRDDAYAGRLVAQRALADAEQKEAAERAAQAKAKQDAARAAQASANQNRSRYPSSRRR